MKEEKIKEAFTKAKQDILSLHSELFSLKQEIQELKRTLDKHSDRQTDTSTHFPTKNSTEYHQISTNRQINPSHHTNPTDITTQNFPLEAVKSKISNISTGNEGVSTDRQTDKQTDNSTGNKGGGVRLNTIIPHTELKIEHLKKVSELINSLDDIKKELRTKIKKLTNQEMVVFTTIYQLEEENITVDYSIISQRLSLTESSIRDYVQRISRKGLPINKMKENNKKVLLSISSDLKKIASLSTIIQLRDL
jgi:cell division protein FtsB